MHKYKEEIMKNRTSGKLLVFDFYASYSENVCAPVRRILETAMDDNEHLLKVGI